MAHNVRLGALIFVTRPADRDAVTNIQINDPYTIFSDADSFRLLKLDVRFVRRSKAFLLVLRVYFP